MELLTTISDTISSDLFDDEITKQTLDSIFAIKKIQENNGELGANRYIISNNESALNVMEIFTLFKLCNWEIQQLILFRCLNLLTIYKMPIKSWSNCIPIKNMQDI